MPRTAYVKPGNPEWIDILQDERERILARDPDSHWALSLQRALGELRRTAERVKYPGERPIKYIGPKIIDLLTKALARDPVIRSDDTLPSSSSGSAHEPHFAFGFKPDEFNFWTKTNKAAQKGKGRAAPQAATASAKAQPRAPPVQDIRDGGIFKPEEGSAEQAILLGLYMQCDSSRQCISLDLEMVVTLGSAFQCTISMANGSAYVNNVLREGCLESTNQQYSLTWKGYRSAERCAVKRGIPRIKVINDDFGRAAPPAPAQAPLAQVDAVPRTVTPAAVHARTQDSAGYQAAKPAGYQAAKPKKRQLDPSDSLFDDLSTFSFNESGRTGPARAAPRAAPKRVATGAFASSYTEVPAKRPPPAADTLPFNFAYLTSRNERVQLRDDADIRAQDMSGITMYKVEFRSKQARHPLARLVQEAVPLSRTPAEVDGATETGWLLADKAPAICPGLQTSAQSKKPKLSARDSLLAGAKEKPKHDPRAMYRFPPLSTLGNDSSSPEKAATPTGAMHSGCGIKRSTSDSALPPPTKLFSGAQPVASTSGTSTPQTVPPALPRKHRGDAVAAKFQRSSDVLEAATALPPLKRTVTSSFLLEPTPETALRPFSPIILEPDSYEVVLLIDHREVKGASPIHGMQARHRIVFEIVNLVLGDYMWVARRRVRRGDSYDEIVLAICERKRKDDFMQSIKDERYREQKRRIQATGVRQAFYMVEEHDLPYETFIKAVQTSISQTLVIDDLTFLLAMSPTETIGHLVRITHALQQANKPIFVIPDELVNPSDIAQMQKHLAQSQSDQEYHTSISSFDRINQKRHTLHSVWSKMINSVSGISEELSVNILDSYPTPIALLAELEQASMDIEATSLHAGPQSHTTKKRKLKSDDPGLHIKRRLDRGWQPRPITGPASERVWQLFTNKSYDAPDF